MDSSSLRGLGACPSPPPPLPLPLPPKEILNCIPSEIILVQSWDEIARVQQLTTKPSQNQHNIGPAATSPDAPNSVALKDLHEAWTTSCTPFIPDLSEHPVWYF